jgi:hypothetical protein
MSIGPNPIFLCLCARSEGRFWKVGDVHTHAFNLCALCGEGFRPLAAPPGYPHAFLDRAGLDLSDNCRVHNGLRSPRVINHRE